VNAAATPLHLQARNLGIGYGQRTVAAGISFDVAQGEIFCLLGPNGCGKTTLFRTLLGLLSPLSGSVLLGGRPLHELSRTAIARLMAYVPQAHAPAFPYAVREVVLMGRTAHVGVFSQPGRADRLRAVAALEQMGIAELADADYSRLSGGQRQLVLLARALAGDCTFMVMDEPTASLDYGNQALVLERIRGLAARGIGVIMSSHDPDHVLAVGHRAALMRDGAILRQGPVAEVIDSSSLGRVYGMAVEVIVLPDGRKVCLPGAGRVASSLPATPLHNDPAGGDLPGGLY
jgi:iron complex transport system ATP-binding protein